MYQSNTQLTEPALPVLPMAGLPIGTTILTKNGEMPVEQLSPGDRIITRDAGFATLRDIKIVTGTERAIAVKAGSLGHTRPEQDVILPAGQKVLVRDWRAPAMFKASQSLVPVSELVDGEFVADLGEQDMSLVALTFDRPHILYAGGLEVESASAPVGEKAEMPVSKAA